MTLTLDERYGDYLEYADENLTPGAIEAGYSRTRTLTYNARVEGDREADSQRTQTFCPAFGCTVMLVGMAGYRANNGLGSAFPTDFMVGFVAGEHRSKKRLRLTCPQWADPASAGWAMAMRRDSNISLWAHTTTGARQMFALMRRDLVAGEVTIHDLDMLMAAQLNQAILTREFVKLSYEAKCSRQEDWEFRTAAIDRSRGALPSLHRRWNEQVGGLLGLARTKRRPPQAPSGPTVIESETELARVYGEVRS